MKTRKSEEFVEKVKARIASRKPLTVVRGTIPTLRYIALRLCQDRVPLTWVTTHEERGWLPPDAKVWYMSGAEPVGALACLTAFPYIRLRYMKGRKGAVLLMPSYFAAPPQGNPMY